MNYPSPEQLPSPPSGKIGWPWTQQNQQWSEDSACPTINIVTPSYNQGQFLEQTIRSVLLQGYQDLRYIVIDGGSGDGSVDIIKKYEKHLTYWTSEPDRGQSHAINKGLAHCTGEIFNWLNSDDLLCPNALQSVAATWNKNPGSLIAGSLTMFGQNGTERTVTSNALTARNLICSNEGVTNDTAYWQPSTFMPLQRVIQAGSLREDMHLTMDAFLMIELLQHCPVVYISDVLARFRLHDKSKTITAGSHRFRLELTEKLRKLQTVPEVLPDELRRQHAKALVAYAEQQASERDLASAAKHLLRAAAVSPGTTISELHARDPIQRSLRILARTLKSKQ